MAYFATPTDEFAVVNHPWQPAVRDLHILAADRPPDDGGFCKQLGLARHVLPAAPTTRPEQRARGIHPTFH